VRNRGYFNCTHTECWLPSESVASSTQIPVVIPVALVSRLNCHWPEVNRNWSPVVAASCGVASIGVPAVVALVYLMAYSL
jgi:hypothetical protein